tara:strand:- start:29 stop:415 length:387 start_codon:yes stop_codon:yes gene_type:complete
MKSINERLADLFNTFAKEREDCKEDLFKSIERHRADSAFTESSFSSLQRAESALKAISFVTKEWLESDEFKNLTQEQVVEMVQNYLNEDLARREKHLFNNSLHSKDVIEASGVMEVKYALLNLLARTK